MQNFRELNIAVPGAGMVILIGASSSGKSTFARKHFKATEIVSSDSCRAMAADTESAMSASADAFEILYAISSARLRNRRLAVIDATNVRSKSRRRLLEIARAHDLPAVALVFDLPEALLLDRGRRRLDRRVPEAAISAQMLALGRALPALAEEGYAATFVFTTPEDVDAASVERSQRPSPRRPVRSEPEQDELL
jgi:protein phosphatase